MKISTNHQRLNIRNNKHLTVSEYWVSDNYPLHWHGYFEIEIIISGAGKYIINDSQYDIKENQTFLLNTTDFHHLIIEKPTRLINISFDENLPDEKELVYLLHSQTKKHYALSPDESERLTSAAKLLEHEYKTSGSCQKQLLQYILSCLLRKNDSDNMPVDNHYNSIKKSLIYIQMHFKEKISLNELAHEAGYNPSYFSELFKKITGNNYTAILNKYRIGHARTLLSNGFSVSETCFLSGFNSLSNFGTIFKKNCGISPHDYAKICQKEKQNN